MLTLEMIALEMIAHAEEVAGIRLTGAERELLLERNSLLVTNLTGHPTVVVPNGFDAEGMPTSICFIGPSPARQRLWPLQKRIRRQPTFITNIQSFPEFFETRPNRSGGAIESTAARFSDRCGPQLWG